MYSYCMWTIHLFLSFQGVCRTSWYLRFNFPCLLFFIIHTPFMSFFPDLTCVNLSCIKALPLSMLLCVITSSLHCWLYSVGSKAFLGSWVQKTQFRMWCFTVMCSLSKRIQSFKSKTYGHARLYGSDLYFSSF